ncbi:hypothetical protein [Microcystis phage Mel-JY01]
MIPINEYFTVRMFGNEFIFVAEENGEIYVTIVNAEYPSGNGGYILPNGEREPEYNSNCVHCNDAKTFNTACLNWLDKYNEKFGSNN